MMFEYRNEVFQKMQCKDKKTTEKVFVMNGTECSFIVFECFHLHFINFGIRRIWVCFNCVILKCTWSIRMAFVHGIACGMSGSAQIYLTCFITTLASNVVCTGSRKKKLFWPANIHLGDGRTYSQHNLLFQTHAKETFLMCL